MCIQLNTAARGHTGNALAPRGITRSTPCRGAVIISAVQKAPNTVCEHGVCEDQVMQAQILCAC